MVKVYIYSKCSTCKNAAKFLEQHKIACALKEITTEPPTVAELERMLEYQEGNLRKLFNTSGLLYKELGWPKARYSFYKRSPDAFKQARNACQTPLRLGI